MNSPNAGSAETYSADSNPDLHGGLSSGIPTLAGRRDVIEGRPSPGYRLFDTTSMGIAAFFGSPIACTALMAVNYHRLGRPRHAALTFAAGIVGTAAAILIAELVAAPSYTSSLGAVTLFTITYQVAKSLQGPAIERHIQQGGELSSRWKAFGLSILMCAVLIAVLFSGAFAYVVGSAVANDVRSTVLIGTKDSILISGTATKQEALKLGEALKQSGYFTDRGVSVLFGKDANTTAVSFVVHEGTWDKPEMVSSFEEIGREIAPSVGGFPIKVRLVDSAKNIKKELTVGKVFFGTKDEVYYYGSATADDANALGQSLKDNGFFVDRGADVFLAKEDGRTSITFVVAQSAEENPQTVTVFETLVRQAAPSIGGLPIELRLDNNKLETGKIQTVK